LSWCSQTRGTGDLNAFRRLPGQGTSGPGDFDPVCGRITVEECRIGIDRGLGGGSYAAVGEDIGKNSEAEGKCGGESEN